MEPHKENFSARFITSGCPAAKFPLWKPLLLDLSSWRRLEITLITLFYSIMPGRTPSSKHQKTFPAQSSPAHSIGFSRLQLVHSGNTVVALGTVAESSVKVTCPWHLNFFGGFFTPQCTGLCETAINIWLTAVTSGTATFLILCPNSPRALLLNRCSFSGSTLNQRGQPFITD